MHLAHTHKHIKRTAKHTQKHTNYANTDKTQSKRYY